MWLSRHKFLVMVMLFMGLSACGYRPAYAPDSPALDLRASIAVEPARDENSFAFVKQLEERLGRPGSPKYRLTYQIDTAREEVGVTPGQEIIRYNVFGKVRYVLKDIETGQELTSGSTDTFAGYTVGSVDTSATPAGTNATIATVSAERDAYARLMTALADQVVTRLIATAGDWQS